MFGCIYFIVYSLKVGSQWFITTYFFTFLKFFFFSFTYTLFATFQQNVASTVI